MTDTLLKKIVAISLLLNLVFIAFISGYLVKGSHSFAIPFPGGDLTIEQSKLLFQVIQKVNTSDPTLEEEFQKHRRALINAMRQNPFDHENFLACVQNFNEVEQKKRMQLVDQIQKTIPTLSPQERKSFSEILEKIPPAPPFLKPD